MKIALVRHGQTEENYLGNIQGLRNEMLNDTGRRQCQRLREKIKDVSFDFCYMSPLVRAVETAIILVGERVETFADKRLIERDMGKLEGTSRDNYDGEKYWNWELNSNDDGVESIQSMFERCQEFLNYVYDKHKGESILIVSHSATYRVLRHLILNHELKGNLLDTVIPNCSYEEFIIEDK